MSTDDAENIPEPRPTRGRPKSIPDAERRVRILDAAMESFVAKGFARTTMTDIAKLANMSKRDLYGLFDDKMALFGATIASRAHLILALPRPENEALPLPEVLRRAFRLDLDDKDAAERGALMNLINRESLILPELNAMLYDSGIVRSRELVMEWLEKEMAKGRVPNTDKARLAGMMMDVVFGVLLPKRQRKGLVDRKAQADEILIRLNILLLGVAALQ